MKERRVNEINQICGLFVVNNDLHGARHATSIDLSL